MLSNVVDVDFAAMTVSLKYAHGSVIFFDFASAFPSMSHDYMLGVLDWIGLPPEAITFIKSVSDENKCVIACESGIFGVFNMAEGIRQGCLLSSLPCVVKVDLLLQKLQIETMPMTSWIQTR